MPAYPIALASSAFSAARSAFDALQDRLATVETMDLAHDDVETLVDRDGA